MSRMVGGRGVVQNRSDRDKSGVSFVISGSLQQMHDTPEGLVRIKGLTMCLGEIFEKRVNVNIRHSLFIEEKKKLIPDGLSCVKGEAEAGVVMASQGSRRMCG